jgi:excisionase family DNA binding protein
VLPVYQERDAYRRKVGDVKILTVKQVADLIQAKTSTVYAWAEQGMLPSFKINGLLRFDHDEVMEWLKGCKRPEHCYTSNIQAGARKGGTK